MIRLLASASLSLFSATLMAAVTDTQDLTAIYAAAAFPVWALGLSVKYKGNKKSTSNNLNINQLNNKL